MKSVHYVSTVANCYKACDAYMESPEASASSRDDLINELWKVAQRISNWILLPNTTEMNNCLGHVVILNTNL